MTDNVKAYMKMMLKSLRSKEQRTENEKYMYHKGFQIGYDYQKKRITELKAVLKDVVIPYIDPVDTDVLEPVVKVLKGGADNGAVSET